MWFDVEDYVTPASNDVPLQAIKILKKYNVPVTMKLVAEKVRFLKEQKRQDVISAMREYCNIGYHSDTHSRHPLVYEYVDNLDVAKGSKEIEKRERRGLAEMMKTFGKTPSCFGHAGSQWAPHYYPYLKETGIGVYLDATDIVNIDDSPYWYCGVLSLNNQTKNLIRFDRSFETPEGNEQVRKRFESIYKRLKRRGGGAISILWHPHTGINKEYWDTVNFENGKNTPKGKYVLPKQYTVEIKERAIRDFENLVRFASSFDDVKFISASDAQKIYRRKLDMALGVGEVKQIAIKLSRSKEISYFKLGEEYVSPAQAFYVLVNFAASYSKTGKISKRTTMSEPLGPMSQFKSSKIKKSNVSVSDLLSAAEKVSGFIARNGFMPSSVKIDQSVELEPSDFLATLAGLSRMLISGKSYTGKIPINRAKMILSEKFVDDLAFKRACEWRILPRSFKAPKILEQAKLQTWTLVPAVPSARASRLENLGRLVADS